MKPRENFNLKEGTVSGTVMWWQYTSSQWLPGSGCHLVVTVHCRDCWNTSFDSLPCFIQGQLSFFIVCCESFTLRRFSSSINLQGVLVCTSICIWIGHASHTCFTHMTQTHNSRSSTHPSGHLRGVFPSPAAPLVYKIVTNILAVGKEEWKWCMSWCAYDNWYDVLMYIMYRLCQSDWLLSKLRDYEYRLHLLKSVVEEVLNLHCDEIELVVVLKSLHVGKYLDNFQAICPSLVDVTHE